MNESKIIKKVKKGEAEFFGLLYDAYIRKIYTFIYYKTHHKELAEDLTSVSFMKALEKIKDFSNKKGTFQAWLYAIARNTVIDHYRRKQDLLVDDAWDVASPIDITQKTADKLQLEQVKEYLHDLSMEQRDIIIMRVWQGLTYKEIAEIMGKQEGSCKMAFSRGIGKLRQAMPLALFILLLTKKI